jgi:hypothetical protein
MPAEQRIRSSQSTCALSKDSTTPVGQEHCAINGILNQVGPPTVAIDQLNRYVIRHIFAQFNAVSVQSSSNTSQQHSIENTRLSAEI